MQEVREKGHPLPPPPPLSPAPDPYPHPQFKATTPTPTSLHLSTASLAAATASSCRHSNRIQAPSQGWQQRPEMRGGPFRKDPRSSPLSQNPRKSSASPCLPTAPHKRQGQSSPANTIILNLQGWQALGVALTNFFFLPHYPTFNSKSLIFPRWGWE